MIYTKYRKITSLDVIMSQMYKFFLMLQALVTLILKNMPLFVRMVFYVG